MKLRMGKIAGTIAVLVVSFQLLFGTVVYGADVEKPQSETNTGGLTVTGYRLTHGPSNENFTGTLEKGGSLTVILTVYDNRTVLAGFDQSNMVHPVGRLNTNSFTIPNQNQVLASSVQKSYPTPASGTGQSGAWTYELIFQNMTYTGVGNEFKCDIFYEGNNVVEVSTYSLKIEQCIPYVAPSSSDSSSSSSSATVKGTGFVLKEASYGQETIYAGQQFTLSATMLATNGDSSLENVSCTIVPPKEISLASGNSMSYFGTAKPNQAIPVTFDLVPGANVENGSYTVVLDVKGINAKTGEAVSASVSISIPVVQPERFEIFKTQFPTDLIMNNNDGQGYGSITLVNQGKGQVANVSVDIIGQGLTTEDGKQYLGHIAGGEQKTADFNILASEPGKINAQAQVTYESTTGEIKTLTYDFSINVEDMGDMGEIDPGMMPPPEMIEEPKAGPPLWVWILIGAVVLIAAIVVGRIVLKKRKAKKAAELEDTDGDF